MAFAEATDISIEKSIAQIVAMLRNAGAVRIAQYEEPEALQIAFELAGRFIRFRVPLFTIDAAPNKAGNGHAVDKQKWVGQRNRQRGRAIMLVIKAKLESVESEVETFEEAFLANVVMSDGKTIYERIAEPIAVEYQTGKIASAQLMLGGPA